MFKKRLKKYMPERRQLAQKKSLLIFGKLLHNPNLWHFNRHSVARSFAVGLFFAWVPVPFQMVLAAGCAIIFHASLPLSIALVWITNPISMPALFYFAYKVGTMVLGTPPTSFHFQLSLDWLMSALQNTWQPFLLGCFICGCISATLGYIGIKLIWRHFTIRSWRNRKQRRQRAKEIAKQKSGAS